MVKLSRGPATNDHYLPELRDQVQRATGAHRKRSIDPLLQLRPFVASVTRRIAAAASHATTAAAANARLPGTSSAHAGAATRARTGATSPS